MVPESLFFFQGSTWYTQPIHFNRADTHLIFRSRATSITTLRSSSVAEPSNQSLPNQVTTCRCCAGVSDCGPAVYMSGRAAFGDSAALCVAE
jgi:hypothetical protein